jgi:hypothetical protein
MLYIGICLVISVAIMRWILTWNLRGENRDQELVVTTKN